MTAGIGKVTPASDEGQAFAAPGPQDQTKTHSTDSAAKALGTLKAQAARMGSAVYELADGTFLVTRWNLQRELPDLRAVAALLRQMGSL